MVKAQFGNFNRMRSINRKCITGCPQSTRKRTLALNMLTSACDPNRSCYKYFGDYELRN
jgi:hypothetical protein